MSFELAQQCIDLDVLEHDLSPKEKFVLVVLCRFADDSGRCYPSLPTLLGLTGFDVRTARKAIENLVEKGWLSYVQEPGKKRQYTINATKIQGSGIAACDHVQICTPDKNAPGTNLHPVQICTITPDKNAGGTPYKNAPRIKHTRNQEETNLQIVGDSSFSLEPDQPPAANEVGGSQAAKKAPKSREPKHLFDLKALPDKWRQYIEKVRPDLDPEVVFADFAFYWTEGQGRGERRTDRGWSSTWMTWVRRQNNQRSPSARPPKKHIPDHLNPKIRFDESYYAKENPFNPDGSLNWKRAPDTDRNE